tara:strand:- start:5 stop:397 length:393 start_codon:yes stop_codon:yes gene_type:complete
MDNFSWLVGILEGEAYFGCPDNRPQIVVSMTDRDVMERVSEYLQKDILTHATKGQDQHRVKITGRKALYVAEKVEPFMSKRRKEQIAKMKSWTPKTKYKTEGYIPKPKKPIDLPVFSNIKSDVLTPYNTV